MEYQKGFTYRTSYKRNLRIMAVVEGYIIARYSGCQPFIKDKNQFNKVLKEVSAEPINHLIQPPTQPLPDLPKKHRRDQEQDEEG